MEFIFLALLLLLILALLGGVWWVLNHKTEVAKWLLF